MAVPRMRRRDFLKVPPLVGATLLAACGQGPSAATPAPQAAAPAVPTAAPTSPPAAAAPAATKATGAAPAAKQAVTIRVNYRIGDDPKIYERNFPAFMQDNPDVKLVGEPISFGDYSEYFAKLQSMMAGDTLGDVVWVSAGSGPFLSEVFNGFFRPIDDLVSSQKYDLSIWYPTALEGLRWGGKLYALPSDMHPGAQFIFYNQKMMGDAGVKSPTSAWTYDDLVGVADKLTKRSGDRTTVFGFAPYVQSFAQEIIARSHGGSFISADGKKSSVKDDPAKTAMQWLYDAMHKQKVATRKQDVAKDVNSMFYAEQAAMTTALAGFVFSAPPLIGGKFTMGAARVPKGKVGKFGGMIHIGGEAIYAKTKFPEQSFRVAAFVTNKENALIRALEYGGLLPRKDVFDGPELKAKGGDNWNVVLEAMADPDLKPYFTPWNFRTSEMQSVIDQNTDPFWAGAKTVDAGIADLDSALNVVLAKQR